MSGENEMVPITCFIRRKSDSGKAVLLDDGTRKEWVPISQIQANPAGHGAPGLAIVEMPYWLAREKKFI